MPVRFHLVTDQTSPSKISPWPRCKRCIFGWWKIVFFLIWWISASCAVLWVYAFLSNLHDDLDDVPLVYATLRRNATVASSFPHFEPPPLKQHRIVMCSKVGDEAAYLLEWVEWHRLQGVDKFALYNPTVIGDPAVADSRAIESLQSLYVERGIEGLIDIHPAVDLHPDTNGLFLFRRLVTPMQVHRTQQHLMISHCVEKYKEKADWILHMDPDEFIYATNSDNSTLWSFLNGDHSHTDTKIELEQLLDPLRTVGYEFEARQIGMSGRLFDFHTTFALDTVAGTTDVYFDPRDSLDYRMRTSNYVLDPTHLAQQLLVKSTDSSKQIERELVEKIKKVNSDGKYSRMLMDQIRISDVINQLTQLRGQSKAKKLLVQEWTKTFSEMYPPIEGLQPLSVPDTEHVDRLADEIHRLAEEARSKQASYSILNLSGESQLSTLLNDTHRLELISELEHVWMPFFPLITHEQITSSPIPSDWEVAMPRIWENIFERCTSKSPCHKAPSPGWMTTLGKSIYRTASMNRSHSSRTRGTLRGCLRPWVHTCAHDVLEGRIAQVGPKHGIRLDHHQFRSLERRTTRLPAWRGGTAGYADKQEFDSVLRYLSLAPAMEKERLSEIVRRRIFEQFHPIPKLMNFTVIADLPTDVIRAVPTNIRKDCSSIELLKEVQVPCPKSHPYVGQRYVGMNRVHYFLADQYCTDVYQGDALANDTFWQQSLVQAKEWSSRQAEKHLRLCPGWPEARCCTSLTAKGKSIWDSDTAVLITGKHDIWQEGLLPD